MEWRRARLWAATISPCSSRTRSSSQTRSARSGKCSATTRLMTYTAPGLGSGRDGSTPTQVAPTAMGTSHTTCRSSGLSGSATRRLSCLPLESRSPGTTPEAGSCSVRSASRSTTTSWTVRLARTVAGARATTPFPVQGSRVWARDLSSDMRWSNSAFHVDDAHVMLRARAASSSFSHVNRSTSG